MMKIRCVVSIDRGTDPDGEGISPTNVITYREVKIPRPLPHIMG